MRNLTQKDIDMFRKEMILATEVTAYRVKEARNELIIKVVLTFVIAIICGAFLFYGNNIIR